MAYHAITLLGNQFVRLVLRCRRRLYSIPNNGQGRGEARKVVVGRLDSKSDRKHDHITFSETRIPYHFGNRYNA
jgi:hypothetical protein